MMSQDANGDGKLSRDELPEAQAARMFDRGDTNKDGFLEIAEIEVIAKQGAMRAPVGESAMTQFEPSAAVNAMLLSGSHATPRGSPID